MLRGFTWYTWRSGRGGLLLHLLQDPICCESFVLEQVTAHDTLGVDEPGVGAGGSGSGVAYLGFRFREEDAASLIPGDCVNHA